MERREQLKKMRKEVSYGYYQRLAQAQEEVIPVVHCPALGPAA
jgi:hypothetical protein